MFVLGGLVCWTLSKVLNPRYWYVILCLGIIGYIVHGIVLDPLIGYPPWRDHNSAISLENVSLIYRAISWFSFSVIISGSVFGGSLFTRHKIKNETSNKVNPHG